MDRRVFTRTLSAAIATGLLLETRAKSEAQKAPLDLKSDAASGPGTPEQISAWMKSWKTRGYEGPLIVSRFLEPIYFLYKPIKWVPGKNITDPSVATFTVPKGFVTDLASIPRLFWSLLKPDGNYAYSAILHDYLYWDQFRPRQAADAIFRQSMIDFKIARATVEMIYQAVRLGGQKSWDSNRLLREHGESRVLATFPADPGISWLTWKQDPSHFLHTSSS